MAWTAPTDKSTGDVITAAAWNALLGTSGDMSETAVAKVTTAGDITYATGANALTRLGIGSTGTVLTVAGGLPTWAASSSSTIKYKTSTQSFISTTTFADVTASSGNFAFALAANEVWVVDCYIPMTMSGQSAGAGGAQFRLTGPASPTNVAITGTFGGACGNGIGGPSAAFAVPFSAVIAFSSAFAGFNSNNADAGNGSQYSNNTATFVQIYAVIRNGANAGTVTLQAAQNSSSASATILGLGSIMIANKVS